MENLHFACCYICKGIACNKEYAFFTSDVYNNHNLWSCQKVCDALVYLLDNIFIRLELNFIGKLLVFQWELIVLLLLQICFFLAHLSSAQDELL